MPSERGSAAVGYAQQGWHVFPLWWIETDPVTKEKRCACGQSTCNPKNAGKHPLTDKGLGLQSGFKDASNDPVEIERWWTKYPAANIGGVTGAGSGIDVLDIDLRSAGFDSWQQLREQYGELAAETPATRTGSGGRHYFFRHRDALGNRSGGLPEGIDVRGDGGYAVLPPSENVSGPYGWAIPFERESVPAWPQWLLDLIDGDTKAVTADRQYANPYGLPARIGDGKRNALLTSMAGTLRRRNFGAAEIYESLCVLNRSRCDPPLDDDEVRKIADSVSNYEAIINHDLEYTDLGNARQLIRRHGADLRYCYTWNKWLYWTGQRWAWDLSGEVMRRAKHTMEMLRAEAEAIRDADARSAMVKHALRSQSANKLDAMVRLALSETEILLDHEVLDANPWLICCRNGTIDLKTGELLEHGKEHYITKMVDHEYHPDATTTDWNRVLRDALITPELVAYFQRFMGHCLTGIVSEDKFFLWWGSGANAKSTIQEALLDVLGPYAGVTDPALIMERRGEAHPTGLADLFGRRLVFAQETEQGKALNETLVKQLTGGDRIKARRMREDFWEFEPTHKLVLVTNHKPTVRDNGPAFWRRVVIIPFKRIFKPEEQDRFLPHKLAMEAEGILAWLVQGCLLWQREGLNEPQTILDAVEEYRQEQDIFGAWLSSRCEEGIEYEEETAALHEDYCDWLRLGGWRNVPHIQTFAGLMTERGYEKRRSNGRHVRPGVRLKAATAVEREPTSLHAKRVSQLSFG